MTSKTQKRKSKKRKTNPTSSSSAKSKKRGKSFKTAVDQTDHSSSNGNGNAKGPLLDTLSAHRPDWDDFVSHLGSRPKRRSVAVLLGDYSKSPLQWAANEVLADSEWKSLINDMYAVVRGKKAVDDSVLAMAVEAAHQLRSTTQTPDSILATLSITWATRFLAKADNEDAWWGILDALISQCDCKNANLDHWGFQLAAIELPLTLHFVLPEIKSLLPKTGPVLRSWEKQIDELLDGDGWIRANWIHEMRPLMSTWSRCNRLLRKLDQATIDEDQRLMLEWFVRQAMRLTRCDGTQMLTDDPWCRPLFETAMSLSSDRDDRRIASTMLPGFRGRSKGKPSLLVDESSFSEWAGTGVLQCNWTTKSPKVAVACHGKDLRFELYRSTTLLRGTRLPDVSCNGRALSATDDWSLNCWHSDEDIDFLELEIELENDYRLQRQFVLGREDEFLILADVILGEQEHRIDYRLELETVEPVTWLPESETSEVYLSGSKIRSLVMPLAISEWRSAQTDSCLHTAENRLELFQSMMGKNLYCGLFFDLKPRRSRMARTWRMLTVAEHLEIVDADVAVAFRIQVGSDQWVVYRSLEPKGNRSFMGQNHSCEFFVGRFDPDDGDAEQLLMIE